MLGVGTTLKVEEPMTSVACACTSDGVELATATAATSNKNLFTVMSRRDELLLKPRRHHRSPLPRCSASIGIKDIEKIETSASGPRLLISLASPTHRGAPSLRLRSGQALRVLGEGRVPRSHTQRGLCRTDKSCVGSIATRG